MKKKNSSTVTYEFKITNRDKTRIYVLVPDKMGSSRFHYYTNGVSFHDKNTYYYSENKNVTPSETIQDNWYFEIKPGGTMLRTVEQDGFTSLPNEKFSCAFDFHGPNLNKGEWKKNNGRIWLGSIRAEKEM